MSILEIFFIGVGLSMDAFAVAICKGLSMGKALLSYGKIDTAEHNRGLIESITPEEIQQTAKELLSPDRLSKLIYF